MCENMVCIPFTSLHKKRLSTESSSLDPPSAHSHVPVSTRARMCAKGERRTGWSSKLLEIFEAVVLSWVYKLIDMKYSRQGGTTV
jgi:hypothetical protein